MFFFQAEDGIRDLVRSRGLGDVYKRQPEYVGYYAAVNLALAKLTNQNPSFLSDEVRSLAHDVAHLIANEGVAAVSYTHLTLPTSDLV